MSQFHIAEVIGNLLFRYQKAIVGVLGVALLGVGVYLGAQWWSQRHEATARSVLFEVEEPLYKKRDDAIKAIVESKKDAKNKNSFAPDDLVLPNFDSEYLPMVQSLQKSIEVHKGTKAALVSALSLARFALDQKRPELVRETLATALQGMPKADLVTSLGEMQLANIDASMGQYEKARDRYQALLNSLGKEVLGSEVLLRLGLCSQKLGQNAQAKDYYQRVIREYAGSEAANSAKTYLRVLEFEAPNSTDGANS